MRFNYTYRITYGSGQYCDRSRQQLTIEITQEQYGRIIEKVIQGCTINDVPGLEKVVKDMAEQVRFVDIIWMAPTGRRHGRKRET